MLGEPSFRLGHARFVARLFVVQQQDELGLALCEIIHPSYVCTPKAARLIENWNGWIEACNTYMARNDMKIGTDVDS